MKAKKRRRKRKKKKRKKREEPRKVWKLTLSMDSCMDSMIFGMELYGSLDFV